MRHGIAHEDLAMVDYSSLPPILLFADGPAAEARGRRAAEAAGLRVMDALALADAVRLDAAAGVAAAMVSLDGDDPALDALLDRLDSEARSGGHGAVIAAPSGLIDPIAARIASPRILHLADAGEAETALALAMVARPAAPRFHDVGRPEGAALLQQLSEEVGRIAHMLANLSEEGPDALVAGARGDAEGAAEVTGFDVRAIIRARRLREQFFRADLFADPAWDIMLDLLAARLERSRVAVSSLCIAAAVPATTGLRWIKQMTDEGLLERSADPEDGRRVFIDLTDRAAEAMLAYIVAARRIGGMAI